MLAKKWVIFISAALLITELTALPIYAQPIPGGPGSGSFRPGMPGPGMPGPGMPLGPGPMMNGPAMMLPLLLRGANLTAEQHTQISQIMNNHHATFTDLFDQLRTAQEKLADELFGAGGLQETELAQQSQQVSQLRNQLAQEGLKVMLDIRAILTPEQLAKAAQLRQQMQTQRRELRKFFGPSH